MADDEVTISDNELDPLLLQHAEFLFLMENNNIDEFARYLRELPEPLDKNDVREMLQMLLQAMCERGKEKFLKLVLDDKRFVKYADLNRANPVNGNTCLILAACNDAANCIQMLLVAGACIFHCNHDNYSALDVASERGHYSSVCALLSHVNGCRARNAFSGAGLRKFLYSGLTTAVEFQHEEIVRLYTEASVDVNMNFDQEIGSALHCAVEANNLDCVNLLLNSGANVDILRTERLQTPLMLAAQHGHRNIMQRLVAAGADINRQTEECSTALTLACHFGQSDCVSFLLDHGADVNIINRWGFNALFMGTDSLEVMKQLLAAGAQVNQLCGERDEAPLHLAAVVGSFEAVTILLQHGADINIRTNENENALWLAVWKGHEKIARMLIQHNSDLDIATKACQVYKWKYLPVEVAMGQGDFVIVEMLLKAGCTKRNPVYFDTGDICPVENLPFFRYRSEALNHLARSRDACEKIMRLMVEVPTLKHLSRLALRKIISTPLLSKVVQLEIPRQLIGYLMLCDL